MAESISGPVYTWPLAIQHGIYAVILVVAIEMRLLRAPTRGGCKIFIDAWLEDNVVRGEMLGRSPELLVQSAKRRTAIALDVAPRGNARCAVA